MVGGLTRLITKRIDCFCFVSCFCGVCGKRDPRSFSASCHHHGLCGLVTLPIYVASRSFQYKPTSLSTCPVAVTVTSISLPSFVSHRGLVIQSIVISLAPPFVFSPLLFFSFHFSLQPCSQPLLITLSLYTSPAGRAASRGVRRGRSATQSWREPSVAGGHCYEQPISSRLWFVSGHLGPSSWRPAPGHPRSVSIV